MAHQLEQSADGSQTAFIAAREPAWHRLGTVKDGQGALTAEQVMAEGKLGGWNVRKAGMTAHEDGRTFAAPDTFGVLRTNPFTGAPEYMGSVGTDWQPFQNEDMVAFLEALSMEAGVGFQTAGSLRGGRDVFITMQLPEGILVGGEDAVNLYLCCFDNKVGKKALRASVGMVRVVCGNTEAAHLATAVSMVSIRHTESMFANIEKARETLGMSVKYAGAIQEEFDRMLETPMSDGEWDRFVVEHIAGPRAEVADDPKKLGKWEEETGSLRYLFREAETQAAIRNTRWAGYNAFTEYLDWQLPVRAKTGADEKRALRTLSGEHENMKQFVFDQLRVPVG